MSSKRPSEEGPVLGRIAEDIPTTSADREALRQARERSRRGFTLERVHLLEPPDWLPRPARRPTAEGWEPFEL